jgi:hypothetical protein
MAGDESACMICLDGSGTLLRKGCACRGSSAWAHAECMAHAVEARRIFRDVLEARIVRHGHTHAATLETMGKLASAMQPMWNDEAKRAESETLSRGVAAVRVQTRGAEHPLTLASKASLALALSHIPSRFEEAAQLFDATIDAQTRVLGPAHAHTLVTKSNYASMLSWLGDDAAAEPIFRVVIAAHRRLMGDVHPHTMVMFGNLAQCLANQHRHDEAKEMYAETARDMRDVLGPMHPDTHRHSRRARGGFFYLFNVFILFYFIFLFFFAFRGGL